MYTDTHCHVLSTTYFNTEDIINNLKENNIKRIIINGYNYKTNKEVIELSNKYLNVYGALGLHPDNIKEDQDKIITLIENNINNPKIIAIGEVGLDFYHNKDNKEDQIKLLERFLEVAETNNIPLIIHNREATGELLSTLKKYHTKGIIHCFSGSLETAKEFIKIGYKLGIGGVVTFKNTNLRETLKNISIENILIETDSPYLSPVPLRGLPNEPANLRFVVDTLRTIYNLNEEELANQLEKNFTEIFDIK